MLAKGIQLSLMIGPIIPIPAPRVVLDALDSVEVRTASGSASGFQLRFQITARSELNTIFLIVITALRAQPGRPRIIPWATSIAAVLVLADTLVPAPLYMTAGVLVVLVVVLTGATRTRAGGSASPMHTEIDGPGT